jgi:hypothetical protein
MVKHGFSFDRTNVLLKVCMVLFFVFAGATAANSQSSVEKVIVPECIKNLPDTLSSFGPLKNWHGASFGVCQNEASPWVIELHDDSYGEGFLTSGRALTLLFFDDPDADGSPLTKGKLPVPIVLQPVSKQAWLVSQLIDGKVEKWGIGIYYYAWGPTYKSLEPLKEHEPDWGDQDLRMFRCVEDKEFSCVSYYDLRKCSLEDLRGKRPGQQVDLPSEITISVWKKTPKIGPEIFQDFARVDQLTRQLALVLADIRCAGGL